jgi:hypothetical protein
MYEDLENPIRDPEAAVTYAQGKIIALACGGIKNICPAYEEGASSAEALTEMGLNKGKASDVIEALDRAGLKQPNFGDPVKMRRATELLNAIGGITCRVVPPPAPERAAPRSTGRQAASSAASSRAGNDRLEADIQRLMRTKGMNRNEALAYLRALLF